jgi:prepilin-type N-terminal cleavage/methylation domain-containing protein
MKLTKNLKNNSGFTLLELMIVMGIMIILAATSLVIFNPAEKQKEQRDALRVAALTQIASTLELYYSDNKKYPQATSELSSYNSKISDRDPSGCPYSYVAVADGSSYTLVGPKESRNFTIPAGQKLISVGDASAYTLSNSCASTSFSSAGSFVITSGN